MSLHVINTPLAQRAFAPAPVAAPDAPRRAAGPGNPRNSTCGLWEVAGRLGIAHRSAGFICRTVAALIAGEAFPAPYPVCRAGVLHRGVHGDSQWPRVAVEAWFDDRLPRDARGRLDQAERAEVDSRLSANAARLFGDVA